MGTEMQAVGKFICDLIAADTGTGGLVSLVSTRVWENAASTKTAFPCIIFSENSSEDVVVDGGSQRLLTNCVYLIRACGIGEGFGSSSVDAIAAKLDDILNGASADTIMHCNRIRPFQRQYDIKGITYYERGGYYQLRIHGG